MEAYITNLGKYNEGELVGEWISLPISEEELEQVLQEIGINEQYEEYFFTDYDCEVSLNLGEYESIEHLNELAEKLEPDVIKAVAELYGIEEAMELKAGLKGAKVSHNSHSERIKMNIDK